MSEQTKIRKDGDYWCKAILGIWLDGYVEGYLKGYEKVCGEKYPAAMKVFYFLVWKYV